MYIYSSPYMIYVSTILFCLMLSFVVWYNPYMSTYKGFTPARAKANDKYLTTKVDNILIRVPKGKKAAIQDAANEKGISVNQFINDAIDQAMEQNSESNA